MSCTQKDCTGKGERRCEKCQGLLCYSCWKFIGDEYGGECDTCRNPPPVQPYVSPHKPPGITWRELARMEKHQKLMEKMTRLAADANHRNRMKVCKKGHPISGKNRVWSGGNGHGGWRCRLCTNEWQRNTMARRRAKWEEGGRVGKRP